MAIRPARALSSSLIAACLFAAHFPTAQAAESDLSKNVDKLFASYAVAGSPGCALGVMRDGQLVYQKGYGNASLEHGIPIDAEQTLFEIGSNSKQFTAAAILLLVQDKKIALTDNVRTYLPELPDYGKPILIDQLLSHTSGLRDYTVLMTMGTGVREIDFRSEDDAMDVILRQKALNFAPGTHHMYSNTNYFLLARIVERVSGKQFGEFLKERIFLPLDMRHTIVRDHYDAVISQRASGYAPDSEGHFRQRSSNWAQPGESGVMTTVSDLAKWDRNFYAPRLGGEWLVRALQEKAVLDSGAVLTYGRGLIVNNGFRGMKSVYHGGDTAGFHSQLFRLPEEKFSAIVLCNVDGADPTLLGFRVADLYLADAIQARRTSPGHTVSHDAGAVAAPVPQPSPTELAKFAGLYLDPLTQSLHSMESKADGLWYTAPQRKSVLLKPAGAQRFTVPGRGDIYQFSRTGGAQALDIVHGTDEALQLQRVKLDVGRPIRLEDYVGTYFSPEIDTYWTIVAKDGKLFKQVRREAIKPMAPVFADAFSVTLDDQDLLRFRRDKRGHVTGFVTDNPRVLNVVFSKTHRRGGS